jgi:hypothetical protein
MKFGFEPKGGAREADVASSGHSGTGCRRGLRLQNAATLCASVPAFVRSQPYRISARIPALKAKTRFRPDRQITRVWSKEKKTQSEPQRVPPRALTEGK